ncbi:Wzz/FepE/Etk N-terminal domain-containing protein [Luteibacter yeojuensis]|uniref:Chain-length determining protein n=1 Tax=Luteibacter yeojuensis TaxID=345309 RepID=A0A7X5QV32_9GAMM|nr:Wzz/FepE/Etk N-terminal domain-containing protein [Luteibacter yeojuensis]NID15941.1 chain-length determining protein [Luteibacter yeojuensis]
MANDDEIYLIDMWRIVVREWRWFIGVGVLVLAATFAYLHHARSQWEATAWIQIGQMGFAPAGQDPHVEAFSRTVERLETRAFQDDVLKSIGVPVDAPAGALYRRSMRIEQLAYANLVKLSVRGYSAEDAKQLATATATVLHAVHAEIGARPTALAKERLDELDANLKQAQADRDRLVAEATGRGDAAAVAAVALASSNDDIRELEHARADLATRQLANYTYQTSMAWPVYVPKDRVLPNIVLTGGIGFLAAAFLASMAAVARHALRRRTA